MDIVVKARHTEVADRLRQHVVEKLAKIERLDAKVIRVDVEMSHEPNPRLSQSCERVELTCRSRGPVIRAEASADDLYAALDLAYSRLEQRLRRAADRRRVHHGNRTPVSVAAALARTPSSEPSAAGGASVDEEQPAREPAPEQSAREPAAPERSAPERAPDRSARERPAPDRSARERPTPAAGPQRNGRGSADAVDLSESVAGVITDRLHVDGDGPLVVREKTHRSVPMTLEQALHEMELVGHDFFLFWDREADRASVVYRRRGYDYGVLRLERERDSSRPF